jgi:hypothetical protein
MDETNLNGEPPEWHTHYLREREMALACGEDEFVTLEEFEDDLRRMYLEICG